MDQPYLAFDPVFHHLHQIYRLYCKWQKTEQGLDECNLAIVFTGQNLAFREEPWTYIFTVHGFRWLQKPMSSLFPVWPLPQPPFPPFPFHPQPAQQWWDWSPGTPSGWPAPLCVHRGTSLRPPQERGPQTEPLHAVWRWGCLAGHAKEKMMTNRLDFLCHSQRWLL